MSMETVELVSVVVASGGGSAVATWATIKVKLEWLRTDVNGLKKQVEKLWAAMRDHSHP